MNEARNFCNLFPPSQSNFGFSCGRSTTYNVRDLLELTSDHKIYFRDRFEELSKYMRANNKGELFVRRLIVNGKDFGPTYHKEEPIMEDENEQMPWETVYFVNRLDFGNIGAYDGLDPRYKIAVSEMKQSLVSREIFMATCNVRVEHVIVNGIDYGSHLIRTIMEYN